METLENVKKLVEKLTPDEQQLLKDTIKYGSWGDCDMEFLVDGKVKTFSCWGYCTNDAKTAGHFSGRKISAMFKSIYKKFGIVENMGEVMCHMSDWWEDGSGDMLFIRGDCVDAFEQWEKS